MKTIVLFTGFAAGFAAGFAVGKYWDTIKIYCYPKLNKNNDHSLCHDEEECGKATETEISSAIESNIEENRDAVRQFLDVQNKFTGIYETLYLAVHSDGEIGPDALDDWNSRIESLPDIPDVKSLWKSYRNTPSEFLDFVYKCGITRATDKIIIADEDTKMHYYDLFGKELTIGERYEVVQPYWHNGSLVLGKGILRKCN